MRRGGSGTRSFFALALSCGLECNPYYPLPDHASWVYEQTAQSDGGGIARVERTVTVESVSTRGGETRATLRQVVQPVGRPREATGIGRTEVVCRAGAVSLSVLGEASERSTGAGKAGRGVLRATLPGLPAADRLVPGFTWRSESEIRTSEQDQRTRAKGVRMSRVSGIEPVQVPAGSFPAALRIESVETLAGKTGGTERTARQEILEWWVKGIGLVKRETRVQGSGAPALSVEVLQKGPAPARPRSRSHRRR